MTFNEFVGVKSCNIDIVTGKEITHTEKYQRAIKKITEMGYDIELKTCLPFTGKEIKQALDKGDEYLNTLPIQKWDLASGFMCRDADCTPIFTQPIWNLYKKLGITSISNAESICLLKQYARYMIEKCENLKELISNDKKVYGII